jgi:hypothetical protein
MLMGVDDEGVLAAARDEGFALVERPVGGNWCWGWVRADDERWPAYVERRQALSWMADRMRRAGVFR